LLRPSLERPVRQFGSRPPRLFERDQDSAKVVPGIDFRHVHARSLFLRRNLISILTIDLSVKFLAFTILAMAEQFQPEV
jgi:hypothetical protein